MSGPQSERYAERGPKGDKGAKGEEGALPARARRSLLIRDVVIIVLLLLNFLFTAHYVNASRAAQERQQAAFAAAEKRQQAAQQKAGAVIVGKLCLTFGELAANKPPAGPAATNPSRAYEQRNHRILDGVGPDIGCR